MRSAELLQPIIIKPSIDGTTLSAAISQVAPLLSTAQIGIAGAFLEAAKQVPPHIVAEVSIGTFVVSVLLGGAYEIKTLKEDGFCANIYSSLLHLKLNNPVWSTILGNIAGHASSLLNPIDVGVTWTAISTQDSNLFYAYLMARNFTGLALTLGVNYAIQKGATKELIHAIQVGREYVTGKVDAFTRVTGLAALDQWIYPPKAIDWPDNTSGSFRIGPRSMNSW